MGGERLPLTPSQTVGPFFHGALIREGEASLNGPGGGGEPIRIVGQVLDGDGAPVDDAVVEIWRAGGVESGAAPAARAFARSDTVDGGEFALEIPRPPTPFPGAPEGTAPSVDLRVFARGLLRHVITRIYFSDESNDADPVLLAVDPSRRGTLVAVREDPPGGLPTYRFDVRLQGPGETVFFELGDAAP